MHRNVFGKRGIAALQLYDHANAGAMPIKTERAAGRLAYAKATYLNVLTDFGDQRLASLFHGLPTIQRERGYGLDIGRLLAIDRGQHLVGESLEIVVLGNKISLAVDLQKGSSSIVLLDDDLSLRSGDRGERSTVRAERDPGYAPLDLQQLDRRAIRLGERPRSTARRRPRRCRRPIA